LVEVSFSGTFVAVGIKMMARLALGIFFERCERNEVIPQSAVSELLIPPESKLFNHSMVTVQREKSLPFLPRVKWENYSCVPSPSSFLTALWGTG
jgi:hypothetical protein